MAFKLDVVKEIEFESLSCAGTYPKYAILARQRVVHWLR